jgi:hypothetical protein
MFDNSSLASVGGRIGRSEIPHNSSRIRKADTFCSSMETLWVFYLTVGTSNVDEEAGMKFHQWEPDLITLVSRMDANEIDLQPDFQRQEVWPVPKRRKLIDSILRGWSMPPVHLIDHGSDILEVLDGQQRLAAIRDFVHDELTVDGKIMPINKMVVELHGLKYSELPIEARRRIDRYTVRAFRISDFLPEEPSELFYRLNQPTLLTAGEQRNSLFGHGRNQLKALVGLFHLNNDKDEIGFSNVRLAYDDVIARLLFFLSAHTIAVKATEGQISDMFRAEAGFSDDVYKQAYNAITRFTVARKYFGKSRLNKASLLSWLLYFSRGENTESSIKFFSYFQSISSVNAYDQIGRGALALFTDRASGRVTDISSVFLRDVCLWLSYVAAYDAHAFTGYATTCCKLVEDLYEDDKSASLEDHIHSVIAVNEWSKLS